MRTLVAAVLLVGGCAPQGVEVGEPVTCSAPTGGFDRFEEVAAERGLGELDFDASLEVGGGCHYVPGLVVAQDLDADGDVDLLLGNPDGFPHLFANDGTGAFDPAEPDGAVVAAVAGFGRRMLSGSAVDLDDDGLPEIALVGIGLAIVLPNLGGLDFGPPQVLLKQDGWPRTCFQSMNWGDLDGDHDLDLLLPGADAIESEGWLPKTDIPDQGTADVILRNQGGVFEPIAELEAEGGAWLSFLGFLTDRDSDGDLDVFVATDRPYGRAHGSSFYRNDGLAEDGLPMLVEDAADVGAETWASGMGVDSFDFNGDGLLDFCMSDTAPYLTCLVSDPSGRYTQTGLAQGLITDALDLAEWDDDENEWTGWGVSLVDFDADGFVDAAATAGGSPVAGTVLGSPDGPLQPDTLWRGRADGTFVGRSTETGFGVPAYHYGLAVADLAGDGYPELVIGVAEGSPLLWDNPCGANAWAQVELRGPPGNSEGFGAQVELEFDRRTLLREVMNLRTVSQSPSRVAFGLGAARRIRRLTVRWPGGAVTEARDLPVRRVIEVFHPEAPGGP